VQDLLLESEVTSTSTVSTGDQEAQKLGSVHLENASFAWSQPSDPKKPETTSSSSSASNLQNISLDIKPGSLVAVVGSIGSGKSSLLAALAGELICQTGSCKVSGSIGYMPQPIYISSTSLKDNVVFYSEYSEAKLQQVLKASGFEEDEVERVGGIAAEVSGLVLSGGQQARLAFARVLYQNADVILMVSISMLFFSLLRIRL
jgi:ATP-binding cassette subfamily C (CFTR/MRP) protein 2